MNRIIVTNLSKKFRIGFKKNQSALARLMSAFSGREPRKIFFALKNVNFNVKKGEIVGVIGSNGSGKSTLLRIIAGIYLPFEGEAKTHGKIVSLIGLMSGFNDRLEMKDNIHLVGSLFGLGRKEILEKTPKIIEFAGLEGFSNTKLYQFSSGMLQRLAFSIAAHSNPDILLLDEIFEIGDQQFRKKSAERILHLVKMGASVLLVSHELWMVRKYCNRVIWMEKGEIRKEGKTQEVLKYYEP